MVQGLWSVIKGVSFSVGHRSTSAHMAWQGEHGLYFDHNSQPQPGTLCNAQIVQSPLGAHPSILALILLFSRCRNFLKIISYFCRLSVPLLENYHLLGTQYIFGNWIVLSSAYCRAQYAYMESYSFQYYWNHGIMLHGSMVHTSASRYIFLWYRDFNSIMRVHLIFLNRNIKYPLRLKE